MCQNTTMRVYGPWIKTYCVLCSKRVVAMSMCYNPALVRDKLLWTPASVKRVYWVKTQCGVNLTYPVGTGDIETWRNMMTSANGNIFRVTSPLCGEFTGPGEFPTQRPVTRSFDVFFDLRPNKRLSKQWRGWWFETLSRPFWRHRNDYRCFRS